MIPTKPAPFSIAGLKDLFETIDRVQRRMNKGLSVVGILLNLIERRATRMAKDIEGVLRDTYGELVFKTTLGKGVKLEESPSFNQSIMEYDPTSKQAQQLMALVDELVERVS